MFSRFLKIEIKRTVHRWQTLVALVLFMGIFIHISIMNRREIPTVDSFPVEMINELNNPFINYLNAFSGISNSYMPLVFPLIILLVVGDSLFLDKSTSYLNFITCRIDLKKYMKYKILSISIISFGVTFIFQVFCLIYTFIVSDKCAPTKLAIENNIAPNIGGNMFIEHPFIYLLIFMFIISLCAMAISIISLISGNISKNLFAAIAMPWVGYLILGQLLMILAPQTSVIYSISPITMSSLFIHEDYFNFGHAILYWVLFGMIFSAISYLVFKKKFNLREKNN